jgi:hypothetical protein
MMVVKEDHSGAFVTVGADDYQNLKDIEDRILDVQLCRDSALDTLSTFLDVHACTLPDLSTSGSHDGTASRRDIRVDLILYSLKEKQRDVTLSRKKAKTMLAKAQNSRALVGRRFPNPH